LIQGAKYQDGLDVRHLLETPVQNEDSRTRSGQPFMSRGVKNAIKCVVIDVLILSGLYVGKQILRRTVWEKSMRLARLTDSVSSNPIYRSFHLIDAALCVVTLIAQPVVHYKFLLPSALHFNLKILLVLHFLVSMTYSLTVLTSICVIPGLMVFYVYKGVSFNEAYMDTMSIQSTTADRIAIDNRTADDSIPIVREYLREQSYFKPSSIPGANFSRTVIVDLDTSRAHLKILRQRKLILK
ncbi:hypothetical protein OSTOST_09044, partial [Ostertagia ostertagi]